MPRASDPNRCRSGEVEPIGRQSGGPTPAAKRQRAQKTPETTCDPNGGEDCAKRTRLYSYEEKRDIFNRICAWKEAGAKNSDSPISALMEEYSCSRFYPLQVYKKVKSIGSLDNKWNWSGRPVKYGAEIQEKMVEIIRAKRATKTRGSSRFISGQIKKSNRKKEGPCKDIICKWKKGMNFQKHNLKKKPKLSGAIMQDRNQHAKTRIKRSEKAYLESLKRTIFMDEKWYTEEKATNPQVEARPGSPIPERYVTVNAETVAQRIKVMYLLVVCVSGPIGYYKLDFKKWNEKHGQQTKAGKKAKGITADFLRPIMKKVAKDAVKKLGPGPIDVEFDRAAAHQSLKLDGSFEEIFGGKALMAAGKAPDMSPLDAGVCPFTERMVEAEAAQTVAEIDKAVGKAWKHVTPGVCEAIMKRVRRNMIKVIGQKGGNFFEER